jgi:hypothetical protein
VPLTQPFQASAHIIRNTIEELHSVITQYTTSSVAAQLFLAPSNGRETPFDVTV